MKRMLSILLVAFALLVSVSTASAQIGAKAYAPENLRSLSQDDQVRVISLEYAEQARGRRIPDDQLRFYLDQVNRSSWGFSRIRQDIATSLGGNDAGWNPGPGARPNPVDSVLCESNDGRYRECQTRFRGLAVLVQNLSRTRCIEGQNWGSEDGTVWVDQGCKGRFGKDQRQQSDATIRCESRDGRTQQCQTGFRGRAVLSRQISSTRCVEGQNWGQQAGMVWVGGGCRAEFTSRRGGGNQQPVDGDYTITCSSSNGRRNSCAWNPRYGEPSVVQQLSSERCRENESWGYQGNAIWVDRGCRARFGTRR